MDEIISEAANKGMYLVDHDNTGPLFEEYEEVIVEADELCEVNDPVQTPFESKYKARTMLDQIVNKLDATRAIAMLEKKKETIEQLDKRIASARVRIGTISWECEEPHNAQTELDLVCQFYFPGLLEKVIEQTADDEVDEAGAEPGSKHEKTFASADISNPPELPTLAESLVVDAMKALNILGILWAGRGQVHKSMLYLLSARQFYLSHIEYATQNAPLGQTSKFSKKTLSDLGYAFTHNLFYLAQAYGNLGDTRKSCSYCHQTLQRQYSEGFKDIRTSLDWVKNCCGISDFYLAMRQYNNCALALASAEHVMKKFTIPRILAASPVDNSAIKKLDSGNNNFVSGNLNAAEIEAELARRWAMLDVSMLKRAFERAKNIQNALSMGLNPADVEAEMRAEEGDAEPDDFDPSTLAAPASASAPAPVSAESAESAAAGTVFLQSEASAAAAAAAAIPVVDFFTGIPVRPTSHLGREDIKSFEDARVLFLRGAARIEAAKKYYVLDGKVLTRYGHFFPEVLF
jgi:hypothetical protein